MSECNPQVLITMVKDVEFEASSSNAYRAAVANIILDRQGDWRARLRDRLVDDGMYGRRLLQRCDTETRALFKHQPYHNDRLFIELVKHYIRATNTHGQMTQ